MESLPPSPAAPEGGTSRHTWIGIGLAGALAIFFYGFFPSYGAAQNMSALSWLESTWNSENDYEHGFLVPIIMIGLLVWQRKTLVASAGRSRHDWLGLVIAAGGALLFVLAHRTGQARLAVGGLPFLLWGATFYLAGWKVARLTAFPLFLLWLAIPVPQFQQATTHLQILSTKLAQLGCGWFGVETEVRGTQIFSTTDKWAPLEIDEGCGGIRSLMALILISSVWAYIARMALWKKALLCLAAFPLAILGNMLRLTSIFVIAEYGDAEFAAATWHDWSGLVIFYPISLLLLLGLHSLLEGGMPRLRQWTGARRQVVRRSVQAG